MFRTWMKTLLHCGFGLTQVNKMTYEPMHSAQAQSVRGKKKYLLDLLVTIVATLQEVRTNNNNNDILLRTHGPFHRHKST